MWYRFGIVGTDWCNYIFTEETSQEILVTKWYEWAGKYLKDEWLAELIKEFELKVPKIATLEMVQKPSKKWLEDKIKEEKQCMEEHSKYIEELLKLLS
jgi:hypothetical protein